MEIKAVMVGPDVCGKTVYLAVLMHRQFVANQQNRWQLEAAVPARAQYLNSIYTQVIDPILPFPEGTPRTQAGFKDYKLNIRIPGKNKDYIPLSLTYLDYPGDVIRNVQEGEDGRFAEAVRGADIVMGLFDGLDILDSMKLVKEQKDPAIVLQQKYGNMLNWLSTNLHQARTPVHFVVTKWDLLEKDYSLEEVKECLLRFGAFNLFVNRLVHYSINDNIPQDIYKHVVTHLVPISSLGTGFAQLQGEKMTKTGQTEVKPQDLTLPLALAVCDGMRLRINSADDANAYSPAVMNILAAASYVAEPLVPSPIAAILRAIELLSRWRQNKKNEGETLDLEWLRIYRRQFTGGNLVVDSETKALESLLSDLAYQILEFEISHPETLIVSDPE